MAFKMLESLIVNPYEAKHKHSYVLHLLAQISLSVFIVMGCIVYLRTPWYQTPTQTIQSEISDLSDSLNAQLLNITGDSSAAMIDLSELLDSAIQPYINCYFAYCCGPFQCTSMESQPLLYVLAAVLFPVSICIAILSLFLAQNGRLMLSILSDVTITTCVLTSAVMYFNTYASVADMQSVCGNLQLLSGIEFYGTFGTFVFIVAAFPVASLFLRVAVGLSDTCSRIKHV